MLKEINKPLLEMITPITSPSLGDSEIDEVGEIAKESDSSSLSVSPVRTTNILNQSESVKDRKHVTKSPDRPKEQKPVKENVKSQKNVVKVASVCKKVERDHKKKMHRAQHEKQHMLRKPKNLNENKQNLRDVANVGIRDHKISEYRIPLRQKSGNFFCPPNRYRNDDNCYRRCVGLGRGYGTKDMSRYDAGPRPKPQPYNCSRYVPNLTPEQQAWLSHMPTGWFEQ